MKFAILLLCLLPLAFGEKKQVFGNILDHAEVQKLVNSVVTRFGSNATEQQCEEECKVLFTNDILDLGCDFVCKGIQSLIQRLYHDVPTTAATK